MYDPLDNMLEQVHASRIYIAVVYSVILVIFGLVCLFRPNGIWSLIQTRLGVKEDGPPSRRARLFFQKPGKLAPAAGLLSPHPAILRWPDPSVCRPPDC